LLRRTLVRSVSLFSIIELSAKITMFPVAHIEFLLKIYFAAKPMRNILFLPNDESIRNLPARNYETKC